MFTLTRNWWALALRGVAAVIFGILAFLLPGITLAALVLLFGAYAFIDGVLSVVAALRESAMDRRWWALLIEGILGIGAAVVTVIMPGITALVLLYVIAFWAIATGIFEIGTAIRLRREISGEWLMILGGFASLVLGFLLIVFPGAGALAVVWWIGAYAVIFGGLLIGLAFRLRAWRRELVPAA